MKRVLFFVLLFSLNAMAAEKVDQVLDVVADGKVEISNVRGDIDIEGWDKAQVHVKGRLDEITESFIFKTEGKVTHIKVKLPQNTRMRGHSGSKLKIFVPSQSNVVFQGVATDVSIKDVSGGVDVTSVSGNVALQQIAKHVYVNNVSGDLDFNGVKGALEVSTVSGNVKAIVMSRDIQVSAVSADVNVKTEEVENLKVSTVSGDAKVKGQLAENGNVRMSCVNGEATFDFVGDVDADVNLQTGPGGDIYNKLTSHEPKTSFIQDKQLRFTVGKGQGSVKMTTVSGSISVK